MRPVTIRILSLLAFVFLASVSLNAQSIQRIEREVDSDGRGSRDNSSYHGGGGRIDRYLEAEIWTDQDDGDYYEGDPITLFFRTNRDAYVAIYSVDTRGRVSLLFPASDGDDNFVTGGSTYRLPGARDNYNLRVSGPEGKEHIQIIASRERFPIPNWYRNSGIVSDWADVDEFMDDLNDQHFVRYPGQRFAYDRAVIFVNEWEDHYYRPIYRPVFHDWDVCGNVYIDYPFGGAVYINGIYWGCAPLYIPRIACGWHTVTIYDPNGYCWESECNVRYYRTVVLDRSIVRPAPGVRSKFREVQQAGYVDPIRAGYKTVKPFAGEGLSKGRTNGDNQNAVVPGNESFKRKYLRGDGVVVKTERGIDAANPTQPDPLPTKGRSHYGYSGDGEKYRGNTEQGRDADQGRFERKVRVGEQSGQQESRPATESKPAQTEERRHVKAEQQAAQGNGKQEGGHSQENGGNREVGKGKVAPPQNPPAQQQPRTEGSRGKTKNPR